MENQASSYQKNQDMSNEDFQHLLEVGRMLKNQGDSVKENYRQKALELNERLYRKKKEELEKCRERAANLKRKALESVLEALPKSLLNKKLGEFDFSDPSKFSSIFHKLRPIRTPLTEKENLSGSLNKLEVVREKMSAEINKPKKKIIKRIVWKGKGRRREKGTHPNF